ncbi:MAG: inorganic phosphate transporter [Archaeoglobaceae archaeon]
MIEIELISLVAFLLIAFSIGSNDTSNAFGICIGCRIISVRKSIILLFALVLIGALFQGDRVVKTVGYELVATSVQISAVALIISAVIIVIANIRGLPVSTHQVIVGSLFGSGVAFGTSVSVETLSKIVLSWLLSPFISGFLAILVFLSIEKFLRHYNFLQVEKILKSLLLCSAVVIAYNMGANELATAIAPIARSRDYHSTAFLGAISVSIGAFTLSRRIAETLCKGITTLDPKSGLSAHFGAGLAVYLFTILGMPVSATYSLVGGITAVGLLKGVRTVKFRVLKRIALNWAFAPILAFILSSIASKIYLWI